MLTGQFEGKRCKIFLIVLLKKYHFLCTRKDTKKVFTGKTAPKECDTNKKKQFP